MAEDQIRYDVLVKDALRSVIKKVLTNVAKNGLPDNHHFFITFLTEYPGVKISSRLKKLYPQQMTIILQHQFWGLKTTENAFEVSLSFSNIPETLVVPFNAIQIFLDPIAAFETTFDLPAHASNNNQKENIERSFFTSSHVSDLLKTPEPKKTKNTFKTNEKKEKTVSEIIKSSPKPNAGISKTTKKNEAKILEKKSSAEVVSLEDFRNRKD